jgi:putative aldouronate transport system substrate-binding protein
MQDEKQVELWGETLPNLLLAPTEEEFDRILEEFKYQREELGFTELMEEKTKIMQETKEKLHIS